MVCLQYIGSCAGEVVCDASDGFVEEVNHEEAVEAVVGEARAVLHEVAQVEDGGEDDEEGGPEAGPGVHGQEGQAEHVREAEERGDEGEREARRPEEGHRVAREDAVDDSRGAAGDEELDHAHLSPRDGGDQASEGDDGREAGEVEEGGRGVGPLLPQAVRPVGEVEDLPPRDVSLDALEGAVEAYLNLCVIEWVGGRFSNEESKGRAWARKRRHGREGRGGGRWQSMAASIGM